MIWQRNTDPYPEKGADYEETVGNLNLLYQDMSWREPLHDIEMGH